MAVSVRLARISDASAVASLTGQLGYDVESSALAGRLSKLLERPDQHVVITELEGRPVGWVHAAIWEDIESEPFVVIGGPVVDRYHRGQGVGRVLMQQAEKWALEQGCSIVRVWSSSVRTEAHRFYERLGYRNIKTQHSFAKSLNPDRQDDVNRFVPRVRARAENQDV